MSKNSASQSTNADIVSKPRSFIVYNPTAGAVIHVHHVVEFAQGVIAREAHESRARRFAGRGATDDCAVIEVPTPP
jgi:hypothetical protein